jgi:hypothetical protein
MDAIGSTSAASLANFDALAADASAFAVAMQSSVVVQPMQATNLYASNNRQTFETLNDATYFANARASEASVTQYFVIFSSNDNSDKAGNYVVMGPFDVPYGDEGGISNIECITASGDARDLSVEEIIYGSRNAN